MFIRFENWHFSIAEIYFCNSSKRWLNQLESYKSASIHMFTNPNIGASELNSGTLLLLLFKNKNAKYAGIVCSRVMCFLYW